MRALLTVLPVFFVGCATPSRATAPITRAGPAGDVIVTAWIAADGEVAINEGSWQFVMRSAPSVMGRQPERPPLTTPHRPFPRACFP
jgi:hypothetical protein